MFFFPLFLAFFFFENHLVESNLSWLNHSLFGVFFCLFSVRVLKGFGVEIECDVQKWTKSKEQTSLCVRFTNFSFSNLAKALKILVLEFWQLLSHCNNYYNCPVCQIFGFINFRIPNTEYHDFHFTGLLGCFHRSESSAI